MLTSPVLIDHAGRLQPRSGQVIGRLLGASMSEIALINYAVTNIGMVSAPAHLCREHIHFLINLYTDDVGELRKF
jgi:hypothetical protein